MHFPNSRCDAVPIQKIGLLQKVTMFENSQITGINPSVDETVLNGFQTAWGNFSARDCNFRQEDKLSLGNFCTL